MTIVAPLVRQFVYPDIVQQISSCGECFFASKPLPYNSVNWFDKTGYHLFPVCGSFASQQSPVDAVTNVPIHHRHCRVDGHGDLCLGLLYHLSDYTEGVTYATRFFTSTVLPSLAECRVLPLSALPGHRPNRRKFAKGHRQTPMQTCPADRAVPTFRSHEREKMIAVS